MKARDQFAALEIPIARRADDPKIYTVPMVRKKVTIKKPQPSDKRFNPEPTLAEAEYENILEIVSSMARVIECSPEVLSLFDEETLRTLFRVQLNARFERRATGETFDFRGKTDILIQAEDGGVTAAMLLSQNASSGTERRPFLRRSISCLAI